jgi:hypothetical protein
MTRQEVQKFREDFQKTVAQLEEQYGVNISLGTIRFDQDGLRATMKAQKGEKIERLNKDDFKVGDIVGINHKKVNPKDQFRIIKIMTKNIKVERLNGIGLIKVAPSLLVKK